MVGKNDKRLIAQCLKNDRTAQKQLYDQYKAIMYSTAYRITNDYDEAHDVLQDAFVSVFTNLSKFRGTGSLRGWIKTIVVRRALRSLPMLHVHAELEEDLVGQSIQFDENLSGGLLDKFLRELPNRSRAVFNLIEVEGYSHKEVGEMMNISTGTSKSQLHFAKQKLKEKLIHHGYEERARKN